MKIGNSEGSCLFSKKKNKKRIVTLKMKFAETFSMYNCIINNDS